MFSMKHFVAAVMIAVAVGMMLASFTYGTNDILFFKSYAVKVSNSGVADLYREGAPLFEFHTDLSERMAHPPGVIHIWQATLWVEEHTGIPFRTWFRVLTVLAHLLTAVALYRFWVRAPRPCSCCVPRPSWSPAFMVFFSPLPAV
jgi:hypothetical protein